MCDRTMILIFLKLTLARRNKLLRTSSGARRKKYWGAKCDVVIYDVTNQIFECDTDKPTDTATSGWLVVTPIWTCNGLICRCTSVQVPFGQE